MKLPLVSIIIVHYNVENELFDCLASIAESKTNVSYEVIVVDNDKNSHIEKALKKKFPSVQYKKSPGNIGYGAGNNFGATFAKGKYLLILSPDTLVIKGVIDELVSYLQKNKKAGIVAPLLLDRNKKPYPLQGSKTLTPFIAICVLSFVHKLLPTKKITDSFYLSEWDKKSVRKVNVLPGTVFLIPKDVFLKIRGFDKNFFLFFEEHDLCMRLHKIGYEAYIVPSAKVVHFWGKSTQKEKEEHIRQIFRKSRFLYFRKHYGNLWAYLVELFCR